MNLDTAMAWASTRRNGVLITLRGDGRPQSSDISYAVDGDSFLISVTDDRAKTRNMQRDARVVLHLTDPGSWSYLSFDGTAELSPVTAAPGDATSDALVDYYERVAGQAHPDWDEYRQAMIDEGRLVVRLRPANVVGQIN
ncbi:MAG: PPOX class F420-dependent oxidoreductase [Acidimicrobiales bacterium]